MARVDRDVAVRWNEAPAGGGALLQLDPSRLGSLELDEMWVPYADLYDVDFLPTRIELGKDAYAFNCSFLVKGHGALMPARVRELRAAGKQVLVVERADRYYVFVSPP